MNKRMPKRSNAFQALVKYIVAQVTPVGARVEESAELAELGVDTPHKREIDILIELDAGVATTRIGVECRDRNRKADIQWIDELIGRYQNLPVDKIIAVSRSGFTKPAKKKAALNNIMLMELQEASSHPWAQTFVKLGILQLTQHIDLTNIHLRFEPIPPSISEDDVIIDEAGNELGPVLELIGTLRDAALRNARDLVKAKMLEYYKVVADLDKILVLEWTVPVTDFILRGQDGGRYYLRAVKFTIEARTERSDIAVDHRFATNKALITTGIIRDQVEPGVEVRVDAVQIAGSSRGRVFVERKKRKGKQ